MFGSSSSGSAAATGGGPVVGLDVGGQVFYFRTATLLQSGSPYLAELVENGNDCTYQDSHGRPVMFLDRSPDLFAHVRDYLVGNWKTDLPLDLRRQLRHEADYWQLKGFTEALQVSQRFHPDQNPCQGILYWLGTNKRTSSDYKNPYSTGQVEVTGWMDDDHHADEDMFDLARFARSRETFIEYRCQPQVKKGRKANDWEMEQFSCLQWCQHANKRLPVILDFKTPIKVRLTHYSLRVSECMGLAGDWNLEASNDQTEWTVLHAARGETELHLEEGNDEIKRQLTKTLSFYNDHVQTDALASQVLLQILEQDFRHTWKVKESKEFYRYFRIVGASDPDGEDACLHGEGLELYGDVYEA